LDVEDDAVRHALMGSFNLMNNTMRGLVAEALVVIRTSARRQG